MNLDNFTNKDKECIICLELIENNNSSIDSKCKNLQIFEECNHINNYHSKCANEWINKCIGNNIIPSCPLCRNELNLHIFVDIPITNTIIPNNVVPNFQVNYQDEEQYNKCQIICYTSICTIIVITFILQTYNY